MATQMWNTLGVRPMLRYTAVVFVIGVFGLIVHSVSTGSVFMPKMLTKHSYLDIPSKLAMAPTLMARKSTIGVVVAHTEAENISWTADLPAAFPVAARVSVQLFPYVADNASRPLHAPRNKGNEAGIYLSYLVDQYENLPDISFFIHAHNTSWHGEPVHSLSSGWAVSHMNLDEVQRRGLVNLRVQGPANGGFNFSAAAENAGNRPENPYLAQAFTEMFSTDFTRHDGLEMPEVLAEPGCSQFAVSKKAIRARSKEDYARMRQWLYESELSDGIAGRIWENLWQWVFLRKGSDVPVEWKAVCVGWGVCFDSENQFATWNRWWEESNRMGEAIDREMADGDVERPIDTAMLDTKEKLTLLLGLQRRFAEERGRNEDWVEWCRQTLYTNDKRI